MDYILYFVFAGIIVIALVIYWVIEYVIAKRIKLKAIEELDKMINEEENGQENQESAVEQAPVNEPEKPKPVRKRTQK